MVNDLRIRAIKILKFICFGLIPIWLLGLGAFIFSMPSSNDYVPQVDAVVILTGGNFRVEEGFKVFKQSKAKYILISGVGHGVVKNNFKNYMAKYDILPEQIILGNVAENTVGNALEAYIFMQLHEYKKMLMVTSRYHIPRSSIIFAMENPDIEVEYYSVNNNDLSSNISIIVSEYNKTLGYIAIHYNKCFAEAVLKLIWQVRWFFESNLS